MYNVGAILKYSFNDRLIQMFICPCYMRSLSICYLNNPVSCVWVNDHNNATFFFLPHIIRFKYGKGNQQLEHGSLNIHTIESSFAEELCEQSAMLFLPTALEIYVLRSSSQKVSEDFFFFYKSFEIFVSYCYFSLKLRINSWRRISYRLYINCLLKLEDLVPHTKTKQQFLTPCVRKQLSRYSPHVLRTSVIFLSTRTPKTFTVFSYN